MPIAVDHETRIALPDQRRIEALGQQLGDAEGADIPGDMAGPLLLGHAEVATATRQQVARMLADEDDRRGRVAAATSNRAWLVGLDQHGSRTQWQTLKR